MVFDHNALTTTTDPEAAARGCALYLVVSALTERLRSVFVPYFRYLFDDICTQLAKAVASPASQRGPGRQAAAILALSPWLLRLRIVRALHRCFLYDSGNLMDEGRVLRLLPLLINQVRFCWYTGNQLVCTSSLLCCFFLVILGFSNILNNDTQMGSAPPAQLLDALTTSDVDADLDATLVLGQHSTPLADVAGRAAIGTLVQAAIRGGSDALWKPINTQALMQTRSPLARTRLLGLEVTAQLVTQLREEFLVLLPESLPFLAEVLEDIEVVVEARAKDVVKELESLSGESLQQYLAV